MNNHLVITISLLAITLAGCATPARNENMVASGKFEHQKRSSKFYNAIKDTTVMGGSETIPLWTSQVSSEDFQLALNKSLKKAGLISPNGQYELSARLIALDQPLAGVGMTVRATVEYIIKDKVTHAIIFNETVHSAYTAGITDSILCVERLRLANEGASRRNIEILLKKISRY